MQQAEASSGTEAAESLNELQESINGAMRRRMSRASERLQVSPEDGDRRR